MKLSTNPGYREGTVPTKNIRILTAVDEDVDIQLRDLEGALGVEAAAATIYERVKQLGSFAGFEMQEDPVAVCRDFLTYR